MFSFCTFITLLIFLQNTHVLRNKQTTMKLKGRDMLIDNASRWKLYERKKIIQNLN
jgi:hypothetical protein